VNSYSFRQGCRSRGDFRIDEIMEFFRLMQEAFRFVALYDTKEDPVELTASFVRKLFEKGVDNRFPQIGVVEHFFTMQPRRRDDNTVRFEIHTGTHPEKVFIDTYDIQMGDPRKVPDLSYFERSIEIFHPFEAYVAESENEYQLNAYNRQQAIPQFDKPAIIRGFHYLDEGMASSIGGINFCLKAPAWHVERFCDGVLIELVPGLFDSSNPEHLQVQEEVMGYFNLL